jgi:propionyl-CoA carboxylase beta chain
VNVLHRQEIDKSEEPDKVRQEKIEEFTERFTGPFEAVAKGFAQAAILPRETRWRFFQALELFRNKKEDRPRKKHGLMPV